MAYLRDDVERAFELLSSALPIYVQIGNRGCSTHCLESTAAVVVAAGQPRPGAELLGTAERMRELPGVAAPPYERIVRERGVNAVKAALEHNALAMAWERGRELGFEDAMAHARALAERPASTTLAKR